MKPKRVKHLPEFLNYLTLMTPTMRVIPDWCLGDWMALSDIPFFFFFFFFFFVLITDFSFLFFFFSLSCMP